MTDSKTLDMGLRNARALLTVAQEKRQEAETATLAAVAADGEGLAAATEADLRATILIDQARSELDVLIEKARAAGDQEAVAFGEQILQEADDAGLPDDRDEVPDAERDEADRELGEAAAELLNRARR